MESPVLSIHWGAKACRSTAAGEIFRSSAAFTKLLTALSLVFHALDKDRWTSYRLALQTKTGMVLLCPSATSRAPSPLTNCTLMHVPTTTPTSCLKRQEQSMHPIKLWSKHPTTFAPFAIRTDRYGPVPRLHLPTFNAPTGPRNQQYRPNMACPNYNSYNGLRNTFRPQPQPYIGLRIIGTIGM
jgi:hypothetical protein